MRRNRLRRGAIVALTMAAALTVTSVGVAAGAGSEGPVTVKVGELPPVLGVSFGPKALPRTDQTPISLGLEGEVAEANGSPPPEIREASLELDRAIEFHTEGIPTCRRAQLREAETRAAIKACGPALLGEGHLVVEIHPPEQNWVTERSRLLLFNGAPSGGEARLLAQAYLELESESVVATIDLRRQSGGRFGILALAKFPRIDRGWGSIKSFDLATLRGVGSAGRRYHPFTATCPDGKLETHGEIRFEDGSRAEDELTRACTPRV